MPPCSGPTVCENVMRKPLLGATLAVAALLSLTACEKPLPEVTVFSGGASTHVVATCWNFDDTQTCDPTTIQQPGGALTLTRGAALGVSVDSVVAEAGWQPILIAGSQQKALSSGILHRRYFPLREVSSLLSSLGTESAVLYIITPSSDQQDLRGVWGITLDATEVLDNA